MIPHQTLTLGLGAPIKAPHAEVLLQELQAHGLLAGGKAHIISVTDVHAALAIRWDERKKLVWDMTNAQIRRRIGAKDFTTRLNETDFLIVTPGLDTGAAQVLAARVLQEVLDHFLGGGGQRDIAIKLVTGFSASGIECRQLTPLEIGSILAFDPRCPEGIAYERTVDVVERVDHAPDLEGRRLRLSASVDPIIDLRKWALAGHRIEPKIQFEDSLAPLTFAERRRLQPKAVQAVDMSTLRRGLARLASGESSANRPSLIMTASFLTLTNTTARTALLAEASRARALMLLAVIWEITDFEEGLPAGRLEECAALLKPFCRSVFARRPAGAGKSRTAKTAGISGLVAQLPPELMREDEIVHWLAATGQAVKGQASTLVSTNLPLGTLLPSAAAAGFTHATVRS